MIELVIELRLGAAVLIVVEAGSYEREHRKCRRVEKGVVSRDEEGKSPVIEGELLMRLWRRVKQEKGVGLADQTGEQAQRWRC